MTTIFARSSGSLPAAIAVLRISGPDAGPVLLALSGGALPTARRATVQSLRRPIDRQILDRALVLWMPGPDTATGEDVVELHLHGGRAVVNAVEESLATIAGVRAAEAGEFTRRAFANARLDATEVEGLADLLAAETEMQRAAAVAMAGGALRRLVIRWQTRLLQLAARCEAEIDFDDEDDVRAAPGNSLTNDASALAAELRQRLDQPPAERLRDGVRVVIAGPANAGKSTLLNALAGRQAAIVSSTAGTTRDVIEVPIAIEGVPVILIDTAGLRDSDDAIELQGIARADAAIAQSDLVLWLGLPSDLPHGRRAILVRAKADLSHALAGDIHVSAMTGQGVAELLAMIASQARALLPAHDAVALSRRHRDLLSAAATELEACAHLADPVLIAEHLRAARLAFDQVTGLADTEAMLDQLFGRFCIGK